MVLFNPAVYGALRRWKRREPKHVTYFALHLTPLDGHPLALPLAFGFGHLDYRPLEPETVISEAYHRSKHGDFLDIDTVDPASLADALLVWGMAYSQTARRGGGTRGVGGRRSCSGERAGGVRLHRPGGTITASISRCAG
jgi:hypothetical protein